MRFLLAVLVTLSICSILPPSLAGPGDPPSIHIFRSPHMEEVSEVTVLEGELLILYAEVAGDFPMTYKWQSNGGVIGTDSILNYSYSPPGGYLIEFEATDAYDDVGTDSCRVDVLSIAVQPDAWGRIKALFK